MLTRLYRYGPSAQGICKGYIVASVDPDKLPSEIAARVAYAAPELCEQGLTAKLRRSDESESGLCIDTGMVWLHTRRERDLRYSALLAMTQRVAREVRAQGGILLPSAVRTERDQRFDTNRFCGDLHIFFAADIVEKTSFCNLLRLHLPELIALSGRAGIGPDGVDQFGSRRLCNSPRHFAARYFHSCEPKYLEFLRVLLRRDAGVLDLELMDVNPCPDASELGVEVRAIDGQVMWSTVRAQAIVLQALLVRARRMAREGRDVPSMPQEVFERNRVRVIATGLRAHIETQPGRMRPVRDTALELLEDLRDEMQALEVDYDELATLMLGPTLRRLGQAAVQNESELIRGLRQRAPAAEFFENLSQLLCQESDVVDPPLRSLNEKQAGEAAALVRHRWEMLLNESEFRSAPQPAPEMVTP